MPILLSRVQRLPKQGQKERPTSKLKQKPLAPGSGWCWLFRCLPVDFEVEVWWQGRQLKQSDEVEAVRGGAPVLWKASKTGYRTELHRGV